MNSDKTAVATYIVDSSISAAAIAFIAEVTALPDDTTPANRDAIDKALKDYAALGTADKANADVVAAKATLDSINTAVAAKEKADADAVTTAINALPKTVTAADKDKVEAARKAYDALTPAEKKLVTDTTLKKLTDAEDALNDDKQKADAVDKLIKALPEKPTLADKDKVTAANDAYKALTDAQKSYIPTADKEKARRCRQSHRRCRSS